MHINEPHRWWLWNELVALRSSPEKCWHSRLLAETVGLYNLCLLQTCPKRSCPLQDICNPNAQQQKILTNPGIRIYSKISGRCLTRTCTWTCFWKGNCIVKCLVPTSRQQCLHVLNLCVESSSFKWNLNHWVCRPYCPPTNSCGAFPLQGRHRPINSSLVWAKAGQLFFSCCITIYGDKRNRTSSSLFAVLVLLRKNNNTIVPSKITLVPLSLLLENFKIEK